MQILALHPHPMLNQTGDVTLPLKTPSGYDFSMAIIEDVSCGKDRTLVKTRI